MPEFTIDAFVDALTQLPEYGGYEALAGELSQQYPEATFSAMPATGRSRAGYDKGLYYQSMPTGTSAISTGPFDQSPAWANHLYNANPAAHGPTYEALWPALTNVVNPQPTPVVSKMLEPLAIPMPVTPSVRQPELKPNVGIELGPERYQLEGGATPAGATAGEAKQLTEADFPKTPEGYKDFTDWLFKSGISTDEISRRATDFYKQVPRQITKAFTGQGMLGGGEVLEGGFSPPELLPPPPVTTPPVTTPVDPKPPPPVTDEFIAGTSPPQPGTIGVADEIPTLPVIDIDEITDVVDKTIPWKQPGDDLPPAPFPKAPPAFTLPPIESPVGEEIPLPGPVPSAGIPGLPAGPDTNIKPTVTTSPAPPSAPAGTSRMADVIDITNNLTDDQKTEVGNIANQAVNYLKSVGWADSGEWGYARTRNMLTGGNRPPAITQGPLVPWKSMGREAPSTDYISNVGGRDVFPSRLAPGERLGETTAASRIDYVPEEQKVDYLKENYGTKVEPHPVFNDSLGLTGADLKNLPGDLKDIKFAYTNAAENYNTFNSDITSDAFKDAKTVDDAVGVFGKAGNLGNDAIKSVKEIFTNTLGLTDGFIAGLKDVSTWLTTPFDAISTDQIGITPLDIMMVAAGGAAGFGTAIMGKVWPALFKPFKNALKSIFKGTAEKFSSEELDVIGEWEQSLGGEAQANAEKLGATEEERAQAKTAIAEGIDKGLIMELAPDENGNPTYARLYDPKTGNPAPFNQFNFPLYTEYIIVGGDGVYAIHKNGTVATKITTKEGEPASGSSWKDGKTSTYTNLKVHNLGRDAFGGGLHNKISLHSWGTGDMVKKKDPLGLPGG